MAISKPELWTACFPATGTHEAAMADYDRLQAEREAVFEKIKPTGELGWKGPIRAGINEADFDDCNQAAIWFTGAALTVEEDLGAGGLLVTAPGYYLTIGA